jgi:hypothetical protein
VLSLWERKADDHLQLLDLNHARTDTGTKEERQLRARARGTLKEGGWYPLVAIERPEMLYHK